MHHNAAEIVQGQETDTEKLSIIDRAKGRLRNLRKRIQNETPHQLSEGDLDDEVGRELTYTLHEDLKGDAAETGGIVTADAVDILQETMDETEEGVTLNETPVTLAILNGDGDALVMGVEEIAREDPWVAELAARTIDAAESSLYANEKVSVPVAPEAIDLRAAEWANEKAAHIAARLAAARRTGEGQDSIERSIADALLYGKGVHKDAADALSVALAKQGAKDAYQLFPAESLGEKAAVQYVSDNPIRIKNLLDPERRASFAECFKKGAVNGDVLGAALAGDQEGVLVETLMPVIVALPEKQVNEYLKVQIIGAGLTEQLSVLSEKHQTDYLTNETALAALETFGPGVLASSLDRFAAMRADQLTDADRRKVHESYYAHRQTFQDLLVAHKLGVQDSEMNRVGAVYQKLLEVRPELAQDNPALNGRLFQDATISALGMRTMGELLDFRSGADEVVVRVVQEGRADELKKWLDQARNGSLGEQYPDNKLTHHALLAFDKAGALPSGILGLGRPLTDVEQAAIDTLIATKEAYDIEAVEGLQGYNDARRTEAKQRLSKAKNPITALDAIAVGAFGISAVQLKGIYAEVAPMSATKTIELGMDVSRVRGLSVHDGAELSRRYELSDNELRTLRKAGQLFEQYATDRENRGMSQVQKAQNLREYFEGLIDTADGLASMREVREKARRATTESFNDALLNPTDSLAGAHASVVEWQGDGEKTYIPVIQLQGERFGALIHKVNCLDPTQQGIASRLSEEPGLWLSGEGSSTLSTSYIDSTKIDFVGSSSSNPDMLPENNVYYGFADLKDNDLLMMGPADIYTSHGSGVLEPESHRNREAFLSPRELQAQTPIGRYNEVALDRGTGNDRITPKYMIAFGDANTSINDATFRAASYFNVPVVRIDRSAYGGSKQGQGVV